MSSELNGTVLDIQIVEARVKGASLIVRGTASAIRVSIDSSSNVKPMEVMDDSDWFVNKEIDPLPGSPIDPEIPGFNEDRVEDRTDQIQSVTVSVQLGSDEPSPFALAAPTGLSAQWASWTYTKQLPSFSFKKKIAVRAQARIGTQVAATSVQISGLSQQFSGLSQQLSNFSLAKN